MNKWQWRICLWCCGSWAMGLAACAHDAEPTLSSAAYQKRSEDALSRGDIRDAIAELERALAIKEGLATWLALAQLHAALGEYDRALFYLEAARQRHPVDPRVLIGLGDVTAGRGDLGAALDFYRRARERAPHNLSVVLRWASLLREPDDCVQAERSLAAIGSEPPAAELVLVRAELAKCMGQRGRCYDLRSKALRLQAARPSLAGMLGRLYLAQEPPNLLAAERLLALATQPEYASSALRVLYASACAELGDFARAERALDAAEKAEQQHPVGALAAPGVALLRARIDLERGRAQRAVGALAALLPQLEPARRSLARAVLGRALLQSGAVAAGKAELLKITAQEAGYAASQRALVDQLILEGDAEAAIAVLKRLRQARPDEPYVYSRLAELLRDSGHHEEADAVLGAGLRAVPSSPALWYASAQAWLTRDPIRAESHLEQALRLDPLYVPALILLPEAQMLAGKPLGASTVVEQALQRDPDNPVLKSHLAVLYARQQMRLDRALSLAQEASDAAPASPVIEGALGYVLYRRGEYASALSHLEAALSVAPDDPELLLRHGLVLQALGRAAEAANAFAEAAAHGGSELAGQQARNALAGMEAAVDLR